MVKLNIAGTTVVGVPKTMVFLDEKGRGHIYPSLTEKNNISSHYGIPSINLKKKEGYTVAASKSVYTDSSNPNIVNTVKKARAKTEKTQKKIKKEFKKFNKPRKALKML